MSPSICICTSILCNEGTLVLVLQSKIKNLNFTIRVLKKQGRKHAGFNDNYNQICSFTFFFNTFPCICFEKFGIYFLEEKEEMG